MAAWWPQGHVIGWEHTFTHEIRDFLVAVGTGTPPSPSFQGRADCPGAVLAAVEESAAAGGSRVKLDNFQAASAPTTVPQGA